MEQPKDRQVPSKIQVYEMVKHFQGIFSASFCMYYSQLWFKSWIKLIFYGNITTSYISYLIVSVSYLLGNYIRLYKSLSLEIKKINCIKVISDILT